MRYAVLRTKEDRITLAEFPDCPGCQTFAEPGEDIRAAAEEALTGWIESMLEARDTVKPPSRRTPKGDILWVEVPPTLATALSLRWARERAGLTQTQLARQTGVSQQAIAKLERPDANPTVGTLTKVARALGLKLDLRFVQQEA